MRHTLVLTLINATGSYVAVFTNLTPASRRAIIHHARLANLDTEASAEEEALAVAYRTCKLFIQAMCTRFNGLEVDGIGGTGYQAHTNVKVDLTRHDGGKAVTVSTSEDVPFESKDKRRARLAMRRARKLKAFKGSATGVSKAKGRRLPTYKPKLVLQEIRRGRAARRAAEEAAAAEAAEAKVEDLPGYDSDEALLATEGMLCDA